MTLALWIVVCEVGISLTNPGVKIFYTYVYVHQFTFCELGMKSCQASF
jgi:hypothetical protein